MRITRDLLIALRACPRAIAQFEQVFPLETHPQGVLLEKVLAELQHLRYDNLDKDGMEWALWIFDNIKDRPMKILPTHHQTLSVSSFVKIERALALHNFSKLIDDFNIEITSNPFHTPHGLFSRENVIVTSDLIIEGDLLLENNLIVFGNLTVKGYTDVKGSILVLGNSAEFQKYAEMNNLVVHDFINNDRKGTVVFNGMTVIRNNCNIKASLSFKQQLRVNHRLEVAGSTKGRTLKAEGQVFLGNDSSIENISCTLLELPDESSLKCYSISCTYLYAPGNTHISASDIITVTQSSCTVHSIKAKDLFVLQGDLFATDSVTVENQIVVASHIYAFSIKAKTITVGWAFKYKSIPKEHLTESSVSVQKLLIITQEALKADHIFYLVSPDNHFI